MGMVVTASSQQIAPDQCISCKIILWLIPDRGERVYSLIISMQNLLFATWINPKRHSRRNNRLSADSNPLLPLPISQRRRAQLIRDTYIERITGKFNTRIRNIKQTSCSLGCDGEEPRQVWNIRVKMRFEICSDLFCQLARYKVLDNHAAVAFDGCDKVLWRCGWFRCVKTRKGWFSGSSAQ